MSSTIKTEPVIYTKDFGGYSHTEDNFVAGQEITVTITLNEYRNLIKSNAENKINEANREKWEAQSRASDLEKEVESLRNLINSQQEEGTKVVASTLDGESVVYHE